MEFQSEDELHNMKRQKATRTKYVIGGIAVVVLLGVVAGLIAYFVSGGGGPEEPPPVTRTSLNNITEADMLKLDCYPEAISPQENLTQEACEARGCVFEPSDIAGVPDCYVNVETTGFELVSESGGPDAMEYLLRPRYPTGMFGPQFENVSFRVEAINDYLLHFSVSSFGFSSFVTLLILGQRCQ